MVESRTLSTPRDSGPRTIACPPIWVYGDCPQRMKAGRAELAAKSDVDPPRAQRD
jgi:hypothetical protein